MDGEAEPRLVGGRRLRAFDDRLRPNTRLSCKFTVMFCEPPSMIMPSLLFPLCLGNFLLLTDSKSESEEVTSEERDEAGEDVRDISDRV